MAINTTFTTGAVLTAAQMNNLPFGVAGLQTLTTGFTTSSPHTTLQNNGMTLTITEVAGRTYRITALSNLYPPGGLQGINIALARNGTQLKQGNYSSTVMDGGTALPVVFTCLYTSVASGSATFTVAIAAASANTAVADFADGTFPRQFFIEDIGSA
jgi:hypothetical protein